MGILGDLLHDDFIDSSLFYAITIDIMGQVR